MKPKALKKRLMAKQKQKQNLNPLSYLKTHYLAIKIKRNWDCLET